MKKPIHFHLPLLAALTLAAAPALHAQIAPGELVAPKLEISGGNLNFTVQSSVVGRNYWLQCSVSRDVYKTGQSDAVVCNWSANGYRLPSEAEWEKAARGGVKARNFSWGDTISHSQANCYSSSSDSHDVSPTKGYHPTYNTGDPPHTSPVGSFAPNGYGLYDMAGNVWEWCWDGYGTYPSTPQTDPRGDAGGSTRVLRGGSWNGGATNARCAYRAYISPGNADYFSGFRPARSQP
ncbi:MAG: SUMF1/EgtB/PvdO family nonheme iron enzyme [Verrucomicrobia bacterium]|nr:SUMF1/EgtB/PvdO family nonheme iron enzyme [Verrucomicrobiota bacterium]